MKKIIVVIIIMATFKFSFAQDLKGKITYQATIIGDGSSNYSDYNVKMPLGLEDLEIKSGKDAVPINFHLFINGNESLYKIEHDMAETRKLGLVMNQTNLVGRQNYIYYNNIETKEKIFQNNFINYILVIIDNIDWRLTKESKKIGEYTAYKATATIDSEQEYGKNFLSPVVAWYTPDIPLSFGIQNFVGLPGLTLELIAHYEDGKIQYSATKIELNSEEEINIQKPEAKQIISEKEYVIKIKELNSRRKSW